MSGASQGVFVCLRHGPALHCSLTTNGEILLFAALAGFATLITLLLVISLHLTAKRLR